MKTCLSPMKKLGLSIFFATSLGIIATYPSLSLDETTTTITTQTSTVLTPEAALKNVQSVAHRLKRATLDVINNLKDGTW